MTVSASDKASAEATAGTVSGAAEEHRAQALSKPFALAGWAVNPALNKIQHPEIGERHLEPRLMKLLCYLSANQGEVLSRDELVSELWPHVIVNENSLTRAVSELRKHLVADARQSRNLIRTVPKRGYLLNEPVTRLTPEPIRNTQLTANTTHTAMPPVIANSFGSSAWQFLQRPLASAGTAAALSICLTLALGFDSGAPSSSSGPVLTKLQDEVVGLEAPLYGAEISLSSAWATAETAVGSIEKPAIAADGERFAFIKHDISGSAIYLGELSSDEEPVVVFMEASKISNLTWSPLGDALLFVREPGMTTAALFESQGVDSKRELLSLDLQTLEIRRLIEDSASESEEEAPISSLTYQTSEPEQAAVVEVVAVEPV